MQNKPIRRIKRYRIEPHGCTSPPAPTAAAQGDASEENTGSKGATARTNDEEPDADQGNNHESRGNQDSVPSGQRDDSADQPCRDTEEYESETASAEAREDESRDDEGDRAYD